MDTKYKELSVIQPVTSFLLVKPEEVKPNRESTTATGIVIAKVNDDRLDLAVTKGEVLAVGSEVSGYQIGQIVYYNFFSGNQIIQAGKDPLGKDDVILHIVWQNDLLAVEK